MSRNLVILLVALSAGVAGLIVFSKLRSQPDPQLAANQPVEVPVTTGTQPMSAPPANPVRPAPVTLANTPTSPGRATTIPSQPGNTLVNQPLPVLQTETNDFTLEIKPLPILEKDYTATTNRDTRLDIMMDIADTSSAESVQALTRLFEAETDPELKVDLIDSLLGIEGFKDEKLIMLTMGARQGLPGEVRQSAIDGLIDLDDQRVIAVLNGLLNDPDEEIRESAQDAIEMLQSEPAVKLR